MNLLLKAALALLSCAFVSFAGAAQPPPAMGQPKDFELPAKTTRTLDNGVRITFIEYGEIPKVTVTAITRAGNLNEGKNTWLADLTAEMLKEGAGGLDSQQIAQKAASLGGSVGVAVGADETTASMDVLSEKGPEAVALIADVLRRPTFPESEFERVKRNFERQLIQARAVPQSLASEALLATLYPDHPYGRLFPSEEQLRAYTLADVRRFHAENFGAARTRIYVAGKFERAAMEDALAKAFGDWARGPDPLMAPASAVNKASVKLVDRPGAPQSTILMGVPTIDPSHPRYLSVSLTNTLLGGSFISRITTNIREDKGYAYSPASSVAARYRSAYWSEQADVNTPDTGAALGEILKEIDRLRAEPPQATELRGFQNYRAGVFVIQNSTRGALIGQLAFIDLHGLPEEYLTRFVDRVYAFTPQEISAAARDFIDPAQMTVVIVGDLAKVRPQLEAMPRIKPLLR